jgi:RNA polymerase subunit RPABC4/transcription elongation factor Spt4
MKIRYKLIKQIVNDLFLNLNIISYPIDIKDVYIKCRKNKYKKFRAISYTQEMKNYNLSANEVISWLGSEEGCTDYEPIKKRYLVYYNDLNSYYKSPQRIRWTLAHELGHIFLEHHCLTNKTRLFRNNLSDEEYKWMEAEANQFSSLLLANPLILDKLNVKSEFDISKICYLSKEASIYRFQGYLDWCKYKYIDYKDIKVLSKFHDFIYKKKCSRCEYGFISERASFCPICGYNKLIRGDGKMIYNDGYNLDENGRSLMCPTCENDEMLNDTAYCRICGEMLINRCTATEEVWEENEYGGMTKTKDKCGKLAAGNSRYCEYCGKATTFYEQSLLKDWKVSQQDIKSNMPVDDGDIPF